MSAIGQKAPRCVLCLLAGSFVANFFLLDARLDKYCFHMRAHVAFTVPIKCMRLINEA